MSNISTLSTQVTNERRAMTTNAQALRKSVPVRDIDIISEGIISYQGRYVEMTPKAFTQLMRLIGMSKQFANQFEQLFNAETKAKFINTMKNAMAANLNEITLVMSPIQKKIVGFSKRAEEMISNERFLDLAEGIIGDHGMQITNWSVDGETGGVSINAFNPKAQFDIGISDEVFTAGLTLKNSPFGGIQVMPYVNRLWCANGCTTMEEADKYTLHNLNRESMEPFFQHLSNLRKNGFVPTDFKQNVTNAMNTHASLAEMERAHKWIAPIVGKRADNWIPLDAQKEAYKGIGVDTNELSMEQKKRSKTDQSVWSVINGVTHVATHANDILLDTTMKDSEASQLMVNAGSLLSKDFDMANEMPSPFAKNVLKETTQIGSLLN
jgi:hypothetical protein